MISCTECYLIINLEGFSFYPFTKYFRKTFLEVQVEQLSSTMYYGSKILFDYREWFSPLYYWLTLMIVSWYMYFEFRAKPKILACSLNYFSLVFSPHHKEIWQSLITIFFFSFENWKKIHWTWKCWLLVLPLIFIL